MPLKKIKIAKTIIIGLIIGIFVILMANPAHVHYPQELWGGQVDIDVNSGRYRTIKYRFYMQFETERETIIYQILKSEIKPQNPDWRRVSNSYTYSSRSISPYYRVLDQIRYFEFLFSDSFTKEALRVSAMNVLKLWQNNPSNNAAWKYIKALIETVNEKAIYGPIDVEDLPALRPQP